MNYSKDDLLLDYATRTLKNLEFIEKAVNDDPENQVYEVTQLINSLLGLLIFPFVRLRENIPEKSLEELIDEGWIIPEVQGNFPPIKNLKELLRYLRNAVAHFNLEIVPDLSGKISALHIWNNYRGNMIWDANITITGLHNNVYKFIELLTHEFKTD